MVTVSYRDNDRAGGHAREPILKVNAFVHYSDIDFFDF